MNRETKNKLAAEVYSNLAVLLKRIENGEEVNTLEAADNINRATESLEKGRCLHKWETETISSAREVQTCLWCGVKREARICPECRSRMVLSHLTPRHSDSYRVWACPDTSCRTVISIPDSEVILGEGEW